MTKVLPRSRTVHVLVLSAAALILSACGDNTPQGATGANLFPATFTQIFLVPTDGTISHLTARLDLRSLSSITPTFTFTIRCRFLSGCPTRHPVRMSR